MLVPSGQDVAMSDDTAGRLLLADRVRFGTDRGWSSSLLAASHDRLLAMSLLDDVVVAPSATRKTIEFRFFAPFTRCGGGGVWANGIERVWENKKKTLLTRSYAAWTPPPPITGIRVRLGKVRFPLWGEVDETKTTDVKDSRVETHCLWTWTSATGGACRPT